MRFTIENFMFLASGAAVYALTQYLTRLNGKLRNRSKALQRKDPLSFLVHKELEDDEKTKVPKPVLCPTIEKELFSRNIAFFGEDGQKKIRNTYIIVIGLGGVGSHCAHMLARSGVGKMKVIDFDQVTLSSLNRHATASFSDVGQPKVEVLKSTLAEMAPACEVEAVNGLFKARKAKDLLLPPNERRPDFVVDTIGDPKVKGDLLLFCKEQGLKVISVLSVDSKVDPTRMHISSLGDAVNDPLALKIRWKLMKQGVDADSIPVLHSSEVQREELHPLEKKQEKGPVGKRVRPVVGTMPALFGQSLAAYVLCEVAGKPFPPQPGPRFTQKVVHKIYQDMMYARGGKSFGECRPVMDQAAIEHVICQIWQQRCAVTGKLLCGGQEILVLERWRREIGPVPSNLVLLMPAEAQKLVEKGQSAFPDLISQRITQKLLSMGDDWG